LINLYWGRRDRMVVQSVHTTTNVVEIESRSWRGVLNTTLCDKVRQ